ncbi:MAG: hypothetical protein KJO85_00430 [Gammaproteobacteria bacterium]|nr:hypothetical protein [Gammaproteobacteria bacterium]
MKSYVFVLFCVTLASNTQANDSPSALQESFMEALRAGDADAIAARDANDAVSYDVTVQDVSRNFNGTWLYVMDHVSMPLPPPPQE